MLVDIGMVCRAVRNREGSGVLWFYDAQIEHRGVSMQPSEMRILICDDSIMVQKKLEILLKGNGYTNLFTAKDGQEAVDVYKEIRPHVVFMDIVMPVKSGVEALGEIIAFDPSAMVVMASSLGTQGNLKEAIEKGARAFLQKPIEDEQALKVLASVLNAKQ